MEKLNTPHPALYRLISYLSFLLLLTGQAAAPAAQTAPIPPTPAQAGYMDWKARNPRQFAKETLARQFSALQGSCIYIGEPPKVDFTSIVFSEIPYTDLQNEDIYSFPNPCSRDSQARLTNNSGADFEPRFNKDATSIVFVSDRASVDSNEIDNIYIMDASGANQRRVTDFQAHDRMPTFAPDNQKIAFVSDRAGNAEIYTINQDGTNLIQLTRTPEADVSPDWSPDGQRIAFVRQYANYTGILFVMNPDGSNPQALTQPLALAGRPVWSPDGTKLAFHFDADGDGWYEIAIINADGTGLKVLSFQEDGSNANLDMGGWLGDGTGLVISQISYRLYNQEWIINAAAMRWGSLSTGGLVYTYFVDTMGYSFSPHARSRDDTPPISQIVSLPEFSRANDIKLIYSVYDAVSHPGSFSIEASSDVNLEWKPINPGRFQYPRADLISGTASYSGQPGTVAYFRIQSMDNAGNSEPQKTAPDAWSKLYQWMSEVTITDAREHALDNVRMFVSPSALNQPASGPGGLATVYFPTTGRYAINYQKPGYAAIPIQKWTMDSDHTFQTVLTGPQEQIANGHFDVPQTPLASWQSVGDLPVTSSNGRMSGQSALMGTVCADPLCLSNPTQLIDGSLPYGTNPILNYVTSDRHGRIHIVYNYSHYGTIDSNGNLIQWPDLTGNFAFSSMAFDQNDVPFVMTRSGWLVRWNGSEWIAEMSPVPAAANPTSMGFDALGQLHVLFQTYDYNQGLLYTRRSPDGVWMTPIQITYGADWSSDIAVEEDGTAHIAYGSVTGSNYGVTILKYRQVLPNGTLAPVQDLGASGSVLLQFVPGYGLDLIVSNPTLSTGGWRGMHRALNGVWTNIATEDTMSFPRQMQKDAYGNIYLLSENRESGTYRLLDYHFSVKTAGEDRFRTYILPSEITAEFLNFDVDPQGRPHFVNPYYGNNTYVCFLYRRASQVVSPGTAVLEQSISLPETINDPTLSFFYRINSLNSKSQTFFHVTFMPSGEQPITLYKRAAENSNWSHAWADMTPYAGKTGVLSFRLEQSQGELPANVYLDEISVSSWNTLELTSLSPRQIAYPIISDTWVDLFGINLPADGQILIDGLQTSGVEWISSIHMRVLVPAGQPEGIYRVKVVNRDGNESAQTLYIGRYIFLPILGR